MRIKCYFNRDRIVRETFRTVVRDIRKYGFSDCVLFNEKNGNLIRTSQISTLKPKSCLSRNINIETNNRNNEGLSEDFPDELKETVRSRR